MNLQAILDQFTASGKTGSISDAFNSKLGQVSEMIPNGVAGGAMAGGVMALLVGNKSARKFAGKAATYGGAALLGGLAYKAYQNWQNTGQAPASTDSAQVHKSSFISGEMLSSEYQLTFIKAMIAAAHADGHIDADEQTRIFDAVDEMELSDELKAMMFDLLRQPINIDELAMAATSLEQKTELYLVSCLLADSDHPAERAHLDQLSTALALPEGLDEQLRLQARQTLADA